MREHVLDVVAERPDSVLPDDVDGHRRDDLIVVIDQMQQRFLEIARPRLEQDVSALDAFFDGKILDDWHDPFAQLPGQDVVEILRGTRAAASFAMRQRPLRGTDVAPRINHRQQTINAVFRPLHLLFDRFRQQLVAVQGFRRHQVAVERQIVEIVRAFVERVRLQRLSRKREGRVAAPEPIECGNDLESQKAVWLRECGNQDVHRLLRRDLRQGRRNVPPHPDVFFGIAQEMRQDIDHRFPVADEDGARPCLQLAVAQQRDQRRHENEVRLAG